MQIEITHPDGTQEAWNVDYDGPEALAGMWLENHAAWWQIGGNTQDHAMADACWILQHGDSRE